MYCSLKASIYCSQHVDNFKKKGEIQVVPVLLQIIHGNYGHNIAGTRADSVQTCRFTPVIYMTYHIIQQVKRMA